MPCKHACTQTTSLLLSSEDSGSTINISTRTNEHKSRSLKQAPELIIGKDQAIILSQQHSLFLQTAMDIKFNFILNHVREFTGYEHSKIFIDKIKELSIQLVRFSIISNTGFSAYSRSLLLATNVIKLSICSFTGRRPSIFCNSR